MLINNPTGILALSKREIMRFLSVATQTLFPPMISSILFLCIFGLALGKRIDLSEGGITYIAFIIPGLMTMNAITSSYENASSSLFISRWHNHIQEVLLSPLSYFEMVLGILVGSLVRSIIVVNSVLVISLAVYPMPIAHPSLMIYFMITIPIIFSCMGMIAALWAEDFNMLTMWNTYFIMPLTFLGGVFHPLNLIPSQFRFITKLNPIYYLVTGMRYSIIGVADTDIIYSIIVSMVLAISMFSITVYLFRIGYKLRT
ncbi:MAG: ABC transporter permease [Candidatus Omnitrophica bacterium]|nr:ABC transporter permease [Candidatus Omnitrophota bacterium]